MSIPASALVDAAARYGTPLYVYDAAELDAALMRVYNAFGAARIFYAMKANSNLTLLRRLLAAGVGFECVSAGEIARAELVGATGNQILMNGPAKEEEEYAAGARLKSTFILDREEEVALLPRHSRVLVRVNPALEVSTHNHLATGSMQSKFGITFEQVPQVFKALKANEHEVLGLHVHIGSAIEDANDFNKAFGKVAELREKTGPLPVLDIGGGWAIDADLEGIAQQAKATAEAFGAALWVEPGRYLVARAGTLLTRVVGIKTTGRKFCLLDAGMTELIRPMLYGAVHLVHSVGPVHDGGEWTTWNLAGPACESGNLIAEEVLLNGPYQGQLLAIEDTGAYGASMSSNYLTRPRPPEALWENENWTPMRRRETPADIWAAELV